MLLPLTTINIRKYIKPGMMRKFHNTDKKEKLKNEVAAEPELSNLEARIYKQE